MSTGVGEMLDGTMFTYGEQCDYLPSTPDTRTMSRLHLLSKISVKVPEKLGIVERVQGLNLPR